MKLIIVGEEKELDISPVVSVLNTLLKNDITIPYQCGGKAECGTCRIKIVEGAEYCNKISTDEKRRLKLMNADDDERLACQTYCFRSIKIAIRRQKK